MKQTDKESNNTGRADPFAELSPDEVIAPKRGRIPTLEDQEDGLLIKPNMLARGIVTGVSASIITHTGRKLAQNLFRNPVFMFGLGLASGYLAHKYRKEILVATNSAAQKGSQIALRQGERLKKIFS